MNYEFTRKQLDLSNELRKLWEQHVLWTRSFIISTAASLGDLEPVTNRLMRNPTDFGNLFRLFYGRQIALEFEDLFTKHLQIAGDLVNAAKKGDTAAVDEARRKWYENADEIVSFLAEINPYWDVEDWRDFFYSHLQMTEQEAVLRLTGKYAEDVAIFDEIEEEALKMADEMFEGLIKQFYVC
jgi:hypothetical protein